MAMTGQNRITRKIPLFFFPLLHQKFHLCLSVIELGPQRYKTEEMIGNNKHNFNSRVIIRVLVVKFVGQYKELHI